MASCFDALVELIHSGSTVKWAERSRFVLEALYKEPKAATTQANGGAPPEAVAGRRYRADADRVVTVRAPEISADSGVPFAAYIHPANQTSGPYGGMSFAIFPVEGEPCLVTMVVGTGGLAPDEAILGRPGHARKMQAICAWLNASHGKGELVAWAKQDPTRTDLRVPGTVTRDWIPYARVFERYGDVIYAMYRPGEDRAATRKALLAFLDVLFAERGHAPLAPYKQESVDVETAWLRCLMRSTTPQEVCTLLKTRRYVIIAGPPGTGKTRMARGLLNNSYGERGETIQFHANTTYEDFVGGLAPVSNEGTLGFRFAPKAGHLMKWAAVALADPSRDYLLHIDEINRADLAKVLGEGIFLFETELGTELERRLTLPHDFGLPFGSTLHLPTNLHILGTMNTADRSIALVDVAIRRRFAFVSLWPGMEVVEELGCELAVTAFRGLVSIFIEHAPDEAFVLMPGHSYFLGKDHSQLLTKLRTGLAPLLSDYLAQGYVAGFAEHIRSYLQWLEAQWLEDL